MSDPWDDWCQAHAAFLWNLLVEETDRLNTNLARAQNIEPPEGFYPAPEQVVAGLLFDVVKIAGIAECCFGPSDNMPEMNNLLRRVSELATRWGATGPVDAFMASVGADEATTPDAKSMPGGPTDTKEETPPDIKEEKSTARAAWIIGEWIMSRPGAPSRGRGRRAVLKRLVTAELARQGRSIEEDTAGRYISPALREWEKKNPER